MNRTTKFIVSVLGIVLGISGLNHGIFETLQGAVPTPGLIIQAIGDDQQMWVHGTEEAFTILPNFLLAGILTILFSLAIIVWTVFFIERKHGPAIFLLLFVLLFLSGGGIGHIVFFIPTWLASTHIHKPLNGWRKILPEKTQRWVSKIWPATLAISLLAFFGALFIAIVGYVPGMSDPDQILYFCWTLLISALGLILLSMVSGYASDLQKQLHTPVNFETNKRFGVNHGK
ncbi:MAG: hypothetical protein CVU39_00590 [Chloroflexi bacterium HGW-Chloroflexi-10]|nr:MAG: hypothetical protein CVU39_00590 [Chloroflexi bacterium HGW-Chloroflexi-10]